MRFISFIGLLLICSNIIGQDTTWVQSLHFGSKTRDTLVHFPNKNQNDYEKILLYYTMRCKGGLVSTSTERNKGCGEWDYSCNTSIIDSTKLDSLKAIHPDYIISGHDLPFFLYTTLPTHTYTTYNMQRTRRTPNSSFNTFTPGNQKGDYIFADKNAAKGQYYVLYTQEQLVGLNDRLSGIVLHHNNSGKMDFFRLRIAAADSKDIHEVDIASLNFTEVVKGEIQFNSDQSTEVPFYTPYLYNGKGGIVLEITYSGSKDIINNLEILGSSNENPTSITNLSDHYLSLGGVGRGQVTSNGLSQISEAITIAFWAKGDENNQPKNNSILYAIDNKGNRQLNIHLPWSNGKIFWDCGATGGDYDRVEKSANADDYKGKWNHWAFTKNTVSGEMKIYLNGNLWFTGYNKTKAIQIDRFFIGATNENTNPYFGDVDDFTVWNTELNLQDIQLIMRSHPEAAIAQKDNLVLYLDMNSHQNQSFADYSKFNGQLSFDNQIFITPFKSTEYFKSFRLSEVTPDIDFMTGSFTVQNEAYMWTDSIENLPHKVTPYYVANGRIQAGAPSYYWEATPQLVLNEQGEVIDMIEVDVDDVLEIQDLVYYNFYPAKYEIMSFVTPYGIGLNLGANGKTWIFDITDFQPILQGSKRLLMDQGGEYQEEMDIRFAFVHGTPTRNVLDIQQVWPVRQYNYTNILNNSQLEPRTIAVAPEVKSIKTRVATTGHGQEGEFISRTHSININGGPTEFTWPVWKACSENPVYPQGGTWIYDRAGWCPGAPTDLQEFEIMDFVQNKSEFTIDYGLNTATGDSRYIVNTQVVKYGAMNFNLDAALEQIITPSPNVAHTRKNPICSNPIIEFKNNGTTDIQEVTFSYGINDIATNTYTWKGSLKPLQKQTIALPDIQVATFVDGKTFFVEIAAVNNQSDENDQNNRLVSAIAPVRNFNSGIIVSIMTNGAPHETKWTLKDANGTIIKSSRANMQAFTVYNDTIPNLNGCYQLQFTDSDHDGISWWANSDGNGYIRAKGLTGGWLEFQPDFGGEYTFNFTCGDLTSVKDASNQENIEISIAPSITNDFSKLSLEGLSGEILVEVHNSNGRLIQKEVLYLFDGDIHDTFVDLSNQSSGLYFITVKHQSIIKTLKIIKI